MICSDPIETPRLRLRTLHAADIGEAYFGWVHDPEILRFLELRFTGVASIAELVAFVESVNASPNNLMLGIFRKSDDRHIGNIKLGPIVREHARGEIGYLIGERSAWGQGYASEAIRVVAHHGLERLDLVKVTSGCYDANVGSAKALLKAGFVHEATIPSHCVCEGRRVASLLFGMDRRSAANVPF